MKTRFRTILLISIIGILCFTLSGCSTLKKAEKADQLELENMDLKAKINLMKDDYEQKLDDMEGSKDAEIRRIKQELSKTVTEKEVEVQSLDEAMRSLERELRSELDEYKAKLEMTERGLVVTFLDEILFDSGKAVVKQEGFSVLDSVAQVLSNEALNSTIAVEGHTDNEPIKYSGWKSNWDLSCARALSVLHYFIEKKGIAPERLSAVGYGEYRAVESNDTPQGKAQNRRVEIVILPSKIEKIKR